MRWIHIIPCAALAATLAGCDGTALEPPPDEAGTILMSDNGAVVHRGEIGCAVIDGNGDWFPPDWSAPCGTEVATNSKNLNAKVTVQLSGVPNPTGKIVHWGPYNPGAAWVATYPELSGPPYPCFVLGTDYDLNNPLFTVNWKATVTPSGHGTLVCHYKEKWDFQCDDYGNCAVEP